MLKLLQAFPKQLIFSPYAWAKIKWFFTMAGDLEMSGFGVSGHKTPLIVEDFQTIKQISDGANTEMDTMALNKYIGDMARKKVSPAECARVWIHSHPFSKTTTPSPSTQDNKTFREKICDGWKVDWAVMVIIGEEETYCELFVQTEKFDGYARYQIPVITDWMGAFWEEHEEKWEKEFDKHVIEAPPEVKTIEAVSSAAEKVLPGFMAFSQAEEDGWRIEWHRTEQTLLSRREWILARAEGYSQKEVLEYGKLCVYNSPTALRKVKAKVEAKEADKDRHIKKKESRKEARNGKKNHKSN